MDKIIQITVIGYAELKVRFPLKPPGGTFAE